MNEHPEPALSVGHCLRCTFPIHFNFVRKTWTHSDSYFGDLCSVGGGRATYLGDDPVPCVLCGMHSEHRGHVNGRPMVICPYLDQHLTRARSLSCSNGVDFHRTREALYDQPRPDHACEACGHPATTHSGWPGSRSFPEPMGQCDPLDKDPESHNSQFCGCWVFTFRGRSWPRPHLPAPEGMMNA